MELFLPALILKISIILFLLRRPNHGLEIFKVLEEYLEKDLIKLKPPFMI